MKRSVVLSIVACLLLFYLPDAEAQIEKGARLVGGSLSVIVGLEEGAERTAIGIAPNYAPFVTDNLAVGGLLGASYSKSGNFKATNLSVGPLARYYPNSKNADLRPFVEAAVQYVYQKVDSDNNIFDDDDSGYNLIGTLGLDYFFARNVALEAGLQLFHNSQSDSDVKTTNLFFVVGFQVILGASGE